MKIFRIICILAILLAIAGVCFKIINAINSIKVSWELSPLDNQLQSPYDTNHASRRPLVFTVRGNERIEIARKTNTYTYGSFHAPNFDVDCDGDGIFEIRNYRESVSCQSNFGIAHPIAIRGDITGLTISSKENSRWHSDEVISLDQWGSILYDDLDIFNFMPGSIIFQPQDAPILFRVTSLDNFAAPYRCFRTSVENWDVSHVKTMSSAFEIMPPDTNYHIFDYDTAAILLPVTMQSERMSYQTKHDPISKYNPEASRCFEFNHPIGKWDVSNVENMSYMFKNAKAFNQSLENWDTSKVTEMSFMFEGADSMKELPSWYLKESK